MSRRRDGDRLPSRSPSRIALLTGGLAVVAVVIAAGAAALNFMRPAASETCRSIPWTAVPAATALPAGWSITSNRIFVDNLSTTIVGPAPSGSTQQPTAYVSVVCYGDDAGLALRRAREVALAAGATDVPFADLGDATVAVSKVSAGTTTVYIQRGILVADLTVPSSLDVATLETLAQALDQTMTQAIRGGSDASGPPPAPVAATPAAASATAAAESHVVPDLEALLPHEVAGTTLASQSVVGTTALSSNPASDALVAELAKLGKTASELQIAGAYDPKGVLDLHLFAYRLGGVAAAELERALVASQLTKASPAPEQTHVTISGRQTTMIAPAGGAPVYYYDAGTIVFVIQTADGNLAAESLALMQAPGR